MVLTCIRENKTIEESQGIFLSILKNTRKAVGAPAIQIRDATIEKDDLVAGLLMRAGFEDMVVESVNGIEIRSLSDLPQALQSDIDGFCIIRFMGNPRPLVLDAGKAAQSQDRILEKYHVPAAANLEGKI